MGTGVGGEVGALVGTGAGVEVGPEVEKEVGSGSAAHTLQAPPLGISYFQTRVESYMPLFGLAH